MKNKQSVRRHDETQSAKGMVLPSWKRINDTLNTLTDEQIILRQADIARQLRANGIAYSPMSDADQSQRPWSLDLAPFVIEPEDWATLSAGLEQRARLKQALLADIYGEQSLLKRGLIPPSLVYSHRGYLRDAVNLHDTPELPLFSADVSRSPSGKWYVVDDICQYPVGIGYTLENRLVLSRTLPKLFRTTRVVRIANYFKQLQLHISDLSDTDGRCVMLAHGPSHPHYFEFAYLAKYLGYTLVQVGDLTVRDNRVFLKTVSGLQRVSVIFRFINDTELDPLAIGQAGVKGITGLFQAVRSGGVKILNPLGSGVLDNPALNICLPALCEALLGEPLTMRGPPTYWLGNKDDLAHVLQNTLDLLFRDIDSQGQLLDPRLMSGTDLEALLNAIKLSPQRYVAQERIDRSIAPGYRGHHRVARQITVRTFSVKTGASYDVLPGGLCLLDTVEDGRRPAFDSLIGSKDTWVIAEGPVKPTSLLNTQSDDAQYAVVSGELPSRVAENLFWMGRNAERCETCIRLLRSVFHTLQNENTASMDASNNPVLTAILRATSQATSTLPGFIGRGANRRLKNPQKELLSLLHDPDRVGTLPSALKQLRNSASSVRDRVSDELLQVLNRLDDGRVQLVNNVSANKFLDDSNLLEQMSDQLDNSLMTLSAFAGLAHDNFTHGDGWRFMMLGRHLERIRSSVIIVNTMLSKNQTDTLLLETLLRQFDSVMTYRSRYRSQIDARLVLQLLLLDERNPRSLAFQFLEVERKISELPGRRLLSQADPLSRLAISGLSRVRLADPDALLMAKKDSRQNLPKFLGVLESLPDNMAELLSATYFSHVETSQQLSDLAPTMQPVGKL
ncbi:MAG: circularly permuted type 2 ATP-grasp protein [Granulosicoccus sp.]